VECDGWDVIVGIPDGEVIKIEKRGTKKETYNYIARNIKAWLQQPCSAMPQITNVESAMLAWQQNNEE